MNKYITSLLIVFCLTVLSASAIDVTPGTLASKVQSPETITKLSLSGSINASDLKFIATEMPNLKELDLGDITEIAACEDVMIGAVSRHAASTIPANTFAGMGLTDVELPYKVNGLILEAGAFAGTKLTSINFGINVAYVGDGCFTAANSLSVANCSDAVMGEGVFANCSSLVKVNFLSETTIPENTFLNCTSLTSINAPNGFSSIGNRAFSGCTSLKTINFGSNLTFIGNEAFAGAGLENVDLTSASRLESVGDWAFARMPNLKSIKMGKVSVLGEAVAFECPNLKTFRTADGTAVIPDFALSKSSSVSEDGLLPASVEHIGRYALSGTTGISQLTLPESLESIDDHAMENMTGLKSVTVSGGIVPELGDEVWKGVSQINVDLIVPDGMENDFKSADQWKEFNIVTVSGVEDIVSDEALASLKARFEGDDLIVQCEGVEIERLLLYNPAGQLLIAVEPTEDTVVIDTYGFGTRIFIVNATLADGRNAAVKISKGR